MMIGGYKPTYLEKSRMLEKQNVPRRVYEQPPPRDGDRERQQVPTEPEEVMSIVASKLPYCPSKTPGLSIAIAARKGQQLTIELFRQVECYRCEARVVYGEDCRATVYVVGHFIDETTAARAFERLQREQPKWCFLPKSNDGMQFIHAPDQPLLKRLIDNLARALIVEDACLLQNSLMESNQHEFEFLRHIGSSENLYYRWRVYSYLMGDGDSFYRKQPFCFESGGRVYLSPKQRPPVRLLSDQQRDTLATLLNNLTTKRYSIEAALAFCMKHQQCSPQITLCITETVKRYPERCLPLFYLTSDIIHNSLIGSYPGLFRASLPATMASISQQLDALQRDKVGAVLEVWRAKVLFDDEYLDGLQHLLRERRDTDRPLIFDEKLEVLSKEELDNECRLNGIPIDNLSLERLTCLHRMRRAKERQELINREGPYDGAALTADDLTKIKASTVKIVTYHSLEYLNRKHPPS